MIRSIAFICASLVLQCLAAQTPTACAGQLVPLKPPSVMCQGAAPLCVTNASGTSGRWVWGCPRGTVAAPAPTLDPGLLDSIAHPTPPPSNNTPDGAGQAERLRQLRLQNQQMEQQLGTEPSPPSGPSILTTDSVIPIEAIYQCGILRGKMDAMETMGNAEGANEIRDAVNKSGCARIVPSAGSVGPLSLPSPADSFPTRWKSLVSGTTKLIRRDSDRLYVETVLPDASKQAGCFQISDLEKRGDLYAGVSKVQCVCQYQKFRIGSGRYDVLTNQFSIETPIEITKISPTRIEGIATGPPPDAKFDCEKRTYSKPSAPQTFVWIPE